jgi:Transposase DDE domain group 1
MRLPDVGRLTANDAERLRLDPAMRWIVGSKAAQHGCAASPSQMRRFETKRLAAAKNLPALVDLSSQWIDRVHLRRPQRGIEPNMDSSVNPTHANRKTASEWAYECTCYARCSPSTSLAIWNGACCAPARCTRRRMGSRAERSCESIFAPMPGSLFSTSTSTSNFKYAIRLPANRILKGSAIC